jgi:methyl-accepting chemotaxis protein
MDTMARLRETQRSVVGQLSVWDLFSKFNVSRALGSDRDFAVMAEMVRALADSSLQSTEHASTRAARISEWLAKRFGSEVELARLVTEDVHRISADLHDINDALLRIRMGAQELSGAVAKATIPDTLGQDIQR